MKSIVQKCFENSGGAQWIVRIARCIERLSSQCKYSTNPAIYHADRDLSGSVLKPPLVHYNSADHNREPLRSAIYRNFECQEIETGSL